MIIVVHNTYCELDKDSNLIRQFLTVYAKNYYMSTAYNSGKSLCKDCGFKVKKLVSSCPNCRSKSVILIRNWDGRVSYLINRRFLTGFLPVVLDHLDDNNIEYSLIDKRINSSTVNLVTKLPPFDLLNHQVEGVKQCLYMCRGIIDAATNSGKTSMIASLILSIDCNVLITIHRKVIYNQLVAFLKDCNIDVCNDFSKRVTICMIKTLFNQCKKPSVLQSLSNIDMIIVDECHNAASSTYKVVLSNLNAYYNFFFSGTPIDSDNDCDVMDIIGRSGPVIYKLSNKQMIDLNISQKPTVHIYKYCDSDNSRLYKDELANVKFSNSKLDIIKRIIKDQTLIVVNELDHGNWLLHNLMDYENVEFVNGVDYNEEVLNRFRKGFTKVLISTVILKEGVNINNINTLIFAFVGKSKKAVKQWIGRLIRHDNIHTSCIIVDFEDVGLRTSKQFISRLKIYKEEGFDVINKTLTQ